MNTQNRIIENSRKETIKYLRLHLKSRKSKEVNKSFDNGFTAGVRVMVNLLMDTPYRDLEEGFKEIEKILA